MTRPLDSVDPTAGLYLPKSPGPVIPTRYRSGKVLAWDTSTGEHTLSIDGVEVSDLPMYPGEYVEQVVEGDFVSLLTTTDSRGLATLIITGLPLRPGDPRLVRVPLNERIQRIENLVGAGPQDTAEFTIFSMSFVRFLPFSVYRVLIMFYPYGQTDAGTGIGNRSRTRLLVAGSPVVDAYVENSDSLDTAGNPTTIVWYLKNNTGSTLTRSVEFKSSAADSISVAVSGAANHPNIMEIEYVPDAIGKYPGAIQV
jgi:hypothetical protein